MHRSSRLALSSALLFALAACSGGGGGGGNGGGGGGGAPPPGPVERFGTCFRDAFNAVRNGEPIDPPAGCLAPPDKTADPIDLP
jgi:hypothetical protein